MYFFKLTTANPNHKRIEWSKNLWNFLRSINKTGRYGISRIKQPINVVIYIKNRSVATLTFFSRLLIALDMIKTK